MPRATWSVDSDLIAREMALNARAQLYERASQQPAPRPTEVLVARLDELAAETSRRLKEIWAARALAKKIRRLRRQIRRADLPRVRKVELRSELADAEGRLVEAVERLRPPRRSGPRSPGRS
jgi:hypothetical protein